MVVARLTAKPLDVSAFNVAGCKFENCCSQSGVDPAELIFKSSVM